MPPKKTVQQSETTTLTNVDVVQCSQIDDTTTDALSSKTQEELTAQFMEVLAEINNHVAIINQLVVEKSRLLTAIKKHNPNVELITGTQDSVSDENADVISVAKKPAPKSKRTRKPATGETTVPDDDNVSVSSTNAVVPPVATKNASENPEVITPVAPAPAPKKIRAKKSVAQPTVIDATIPVSPNVVPIPAEQGAPAPAPKKTRAKKIVVQPVVTEQTVVYADPTTTTIPEPVTAPAPAPKKSRAKKAVAPPPSAPATAQ